MALTRSPSLRFLINILFLQSFSCNCLYNLKPRDPHIQGREQGLAIGNWWPKFLQDHIWWWDLEYSYVWQCAMTNVWSCERMRGFFRVDQLTAAGETQEKQLWQKFSTLWWTNYYRQEHVIFFDGLFGFFFYFTFLLYERESLCFSCFALILSLPDWCTWNKNSKLHSFQSNSRWVRKKMSEPFLAKLES